MNDPLVAALIQAVEAEGGLVEDEIENDALTVHVGGRHVRIYLDNLRRRVARGDSPDVVISEFVSTMGTPDIAVMAQRDGLRLMLERIDVLAGTQTLTRELSPEVAISLVWIDEAESRIRFIQPHVLRELQLDDTNAWQAAAENMDRLLRASPLELMDAKGLPLGMLKTNSPLKASLIAAPSLRRHVTDQLGWPVLAVAPCRDFLYLMPEIAREHLGRVGPVVEREFTQSAYPLSPEVFQISDVGIRSIGRFQVGES